MISCSGIVAVVAAAPAGIHSARKALETYKTHISYTLNVLVAVNRLRLLSGTTWRDNTGTRALPRLTTLMLQGFLELILIVTAFNI